MGPGGGGGLEGGRERRGEGKGEGERENIVIAGRLCWILTSNSLVSELNFKSASPEASVLTINDDNNNNNNNKEQTNKQKKRIKRG